MSWGIQYWIIIKIIKRLFIIYFGRVGSKPGVLDLRTYIYIYILDLKQSSINVISWVIHGFSGLFVCLICVTQRGPKWYLAHEMETSHARHLEFCYTGLSYVWYESIIELEDYRRWHWIAPLPITHAVCCTCNLA